MRSADEPIITNGNNQETDGTAQSDIVSENELVEFKVIIEQLQEVCPLKLV